MKKHPLKDSKFQTLREELRAVDNIECGGCSVAAYILYRYLIQAGWSDAHVVYAYSRGHRAKPTNDSYITSGGGVASSCSHAYVEIPSLNLSIDPISIAEVEPDELSGVIDLYDYHHIPNELIEKFIVDSMLFPEEWNYMFDRRLILPLYHLSKRKGFSTPALIEIVRNDKKVFSF